MAVSSKMDDNKMGIEMQQQQKDSKPMMKASAAVPMPQHSSSSSSNTKTTPMPKMHGMGGNKDKKKANYFRFGKTLVEPQKTFFEKWEQSLNKVETCLKYPWLH